MFAPLDAVQQSPTDPADLDQRYLVTCQPQAQGRPYRVTVTDRNPQSDGPPCCGADGAACAVLPPADPWHP